MANQVPQIPGGKNKGTPLSQAMEEDVRFWLGRKIEGLSDPDQVKYADSSRRWIAEARKELIGRGIAPNDIPDAPAPGASPPRAPAAQPPAQRPPQRELARLMEDGRAPPFPVQLVASTRNAQVINQMLDEAMAHAHLVSPATVVAGLPPGCEVAISLVKVDPNAGKDGPGDVANVGGGKFSLSAAVMKKIGAAAGISWDMNASGRLDDGSDPHYVHYRAVGSVRNFDGSSRIVSGEVEIDMRAGSPQVVAMEQRAKENSMFQSQLRDTRMFIIRHAETKAKARAIADMGVKRSYTQAELQKPFKVARLMFTGRHENADIERMFAEKTAEAFLGSTTAMYGQQAAAPIRALQPMQMLAPSSGPAVGQLHSPPPPGASATHGAAYDDGFADGEIVEQQPEAAQATQTTPAAPASSPTDLKT